LGGKYYTKIITIVSANFMGLPEGSIDTVVAEHLTFNPPGDEMSGPFHGFVTDPSGKVVAQYEGTVVTDRITFTNKQPLKGRSHFSVALPKENVFLSECGGPGEKLVVFIGTQPQHPQFQQVDHLSHTRSRCNSSSFLNGGQHFS
jgi:hypothetical protein